MIHKKVVVNNSMQSNYVYYLTEPIGKNFDPEFKPQLTPQEMISLGVFDGHYGTVNKNEFPKEWFTHSKLIPEGRDPNLNFFKIHASQSLEVWQKKGWIHPDDPQGWFLWYCRYYMGRRMEDDERQIKRWKAMTRHIAQIKKNCAIGDFNCHRKQRQALLHWAYDSRAI